MADDVKRIVLQFTGENEDAKGDIEALLALLATLDDVDVNAEAHVATAGAEADILQLFAALKLLDDTDVEVDVDVNTDKLNLGAKILRAFGIQTGNADKGLEEFSSGISRLNVNLPGMLGRLNAVSGAAFVLALAIGVTLVGALGALVASLAAAVAGLAALGAAFAGILGPALLLVIGVVQRLAAVWKVLQAEDQDRLAQEQRTIEGNKQMVSALERRHEAYIQLRRAAEEVGLAEQQALRDTEDAAERATDAILSLQRAQLSQEEATLGIERAKLELKKFIAEMKLGKKEASAMFRKFTDVAFDPAKLNKELAKVKLPGTTKLDRQESELKLKELILGVKDARLREKEATDSVSDAVREKTRAEEAHLKFVKEGLRASPRYIAALRAQADAHRAVKTAQRGVVDAKTIASQSKVQAMTKELSGEERILLGILRQLRDTFKQVFGPGIQRIIMGIAFGLGLINKRIKPLRSAFTKLGTAMGLAIVTIIDRLTNPKNMAAFQAFTAAAVGFVAPLTDTFTSLLQILLNIAQAALPLLLPLIQSVAAQFNEWADQTSNIANLRDIIGVLVEHFITWWSVFQVFGAVFLEFLKIAAPFGLQIAHAFKGVGDSMLEWMKSKEGRDQIEEWLRVAVPFALRLARLFGQILLVLARIGEIAAPILGPMLDVLSLQLNIVSRLLRAFGRIAEVVGKLFDFILSHVFEPLYAEFGKLVDRAIQLGIDFISGLIKGIGKKAKDLLNTVGDLGKKVIDKMKHPWKIFSPSKVTEGYGVNLVQGLINGIQGASKKLGVVAEVSLQTPILDPLNAVVRSAPQAAAAAAGVGGQGSGNLFIEEQNLILPEPATGGLSDPRAHAVQLLSELRRSARKGRR